MVATIALAGLVAFAPTAVSAENLFDFLFGGTKQQQRQAPPQASFFADPFGSASQAQPSSARPVVASSGPAFCVRSCDGKYFPLMRGSASPVQMCQAFCPASATRVYFGSSIDTAYAASGERYADSQNAYAYRKALRADCTCNGRDPAGLAPVDLALDDSLRSGDIVATTDGLVAYSGIKLGNNQAPDFTPVASWPGLTAETRARLNEMKVVAPVNPELLAGNVPALDVTTVPKTAAPKSDKRAELN